MANWDESKHKRDKDGKFAEQSSQSYEIDVAMATLKDKGVDIKGMSIDEIKNKYNKTIGKTDRYDVRSGNSTSNNFNIQLFAAKLSDQSERELRKSKRSYEKRIQEHKFKIANPKIVAENWDSMSEQEKTGLINYWGKEIKEATRRLNEAKERLNEPKE